MMLTFLFCFGDARADRYREEALSGLNGINVVVGPLGEDAKRAGLTQERLETVVSLRLLKAGIPVFDSFGKQKGEPFLYVGVTVLKHDNLPLFFYVVEVTLNQNVLIQRPQPLSYGKLPELTANTGGGSNMSYADRDAFVGRVVNKVEEFVDGFALEYLKNKQFESLLIEIEVAKKSKSHMPIDSEKNANGVVPNASDKSTATQPATNSTHQQPKSTTGQ